MALTWHRDGRISYDDPNTGDLLGPFEPWEVPSDLFIWSHGPKLYRAIDRAIEDGRKPPSDYTIPALPDPPADREAPKLPPNPIDKSAGAPPAPPVGGDDGFSVSSDPEKFAEAVRAFRARVPMTEAQFSQLTEEAQQRAFTVARVAQADVVTQAWEAIDRAVEQGTTFEDFVADVGDQLESSWGGEIPGRLETVFRTNVMGAYNAGRMELINDPDVKEARPFWRFDGIGDSRQSEICEPLDGTVLAADDPFWAKHTPPLHFNCRSVITPLDPEEAAELGISEKTPDTAAADGFGAMPDTSDAFAPDLKAYPPALRERVRESFDR